MTNIFLFIRFLAGITPKPLWNSPRFSLGYIQEFLMRLVHVFSPVILQGSWNLFQRFSNSIHSDISTKFLMIVSMILSEIFPWTLLEISNFSRDFSKYSLCQEYLLWSDSSRSSGLLEKFSLILLLGILLECLLAILLEPLLKNLSSNSSKNSYNFFRSFS